MLKTENRSVSPVTQSPVTGDHAGTWNARTRARQVPWQVHFRHDFRLLLGIADVQIPAHGSRCLCCLFRRFLEFCLPSATAAR